MTQDPVGEYQTDHDLLIRLDEKVSALHPKLDKLTDDHEARIRILEQKVEDQRSSARTWRYGLTIAISVLGLLVGVLALYLKK